jgi:hypothetical protein
LEVSNIDQRLRNSEEHAGSIAALPLATIGDWESAMLPPNEGEHRALIPTIPDRYWAAWINDVMYQRIAVFSPAPVGQISVELPHITVHPRREKYSA